MSCISWLPGITFLTTFVMPLTLPVPHCIVITIAQLIDDCRCPRHHDPGAGGNADSDQLRSLVVGHMGDCRSSKPKGWICSGCNQLIVYWCETLWQAGSALIRGMKDLACLQVFLFSQLKLFSTHLSCKLFISGWMLLIIVAACRS